MNVGWTSIQTTATGAWVLHASLLPQQCPVGAQWTPTPVDKGSEKSWERLSSEAPPTEARAHYKSDTPSCSPVRMTTP